LACVQPFISERCGHIEADALAALEAVVEGAPYATFSSGGGKPPHAIAKPNAAAATQQAALAAIRDTRRLYHEGARRSHASTRALPAMDRGGRTSNLRVLRFPTSRRTMRIPALAASLALLSALATFAADVALREPAAEAKSPGGWLGVAMETSKGKPGVLVTHVIRTSPAEKAGLKLGDRIVKVDGTAVTAPAEVSTPIGAKSAGQTVTIDVVRGSKAQSFSVVLAPRPTPDQIFRMEMLGESLTKRLPTLTLVSGPGPVGYPALDGKVIVVDLFATWCGPCAMMRPKLEALQAKYGPQGMNVLAISDEETATLSAWATKYSVPYTVATDPTDEVFSGWSAPALPSALIVDKHGVVREVEVGYDPTEMARVESLVQALLKEP
jgi:thiol-disulfide isomerase/thioredoxin